MKSKTRKKFADKEKVNALLESVLDMTGEPEMNETTESLKDLGILEKSKEGYVVVNLGNKNIFRNGFKVATKEDAERIARYSGALKSEDINKDIEAANKTYAIVMDYQEAQIAQPLQWGLTKSHKKKKIKNEQENKMDKENKDDDEDSNFKPHVYDYSFEREKLIEVYLERINTLTEKIDGLENLVRNQDGLIIENSTIYGDVYNHGNNNSINGNQKGQGRHNQPGNPDDDPDNGGDNNGGGNGGNRGNGSNNNGNIGGGNGGNGNNNNNNNTGPAGGPAGNPQGSSNGNPAGSTKSLWEEMLEEAEKEKDRELTEKEKKRHREGQQGGPGYVTPRYLLDREEKGSESWLKADRYLEKQKKLLKQNKPLVTLYVEKAFVTNKWGNFLPFTKAAKDNWNIVGRPGWGTDKLLSKLPRFVRWSLSWIPAHILGQKTEYSDVRESVRMRYHVYMIDHREENPKKQLLYKISDRRRDLDEMNDTKKNLGKPYYYDLWRYTRSTGMSPTWSIVNAMAENFPSEDEVSREKYGGEYNKGMAVFDTYSNGDDSNIEEDTKNIFQKIFNWGRMYRLSTSSIKGIPDECIIDKKVISSWLTGTEFAVTNDLGFGRQTYATVKKRRAKSWAKSLAALALYPLQNKETRDDNLEDWKKESYEIDVFNPAFAGSTMTVDEKGRNVFVDEEGWKGGATINEHLFNNLSGVLALFVPYMDREYKGHKFRFENKKENQYHSSKQDSDPYRLWQKYGLREVA